MRFAVFYCSSEFDRDSLATELGHMFGDTPLIGCATSQEMNVHGPCRGTLIGMSMASDSLVVATERTDISNGVQTSLTDQITTRLVEELDSTRTESTSHVTFGLLVADWISIPSELLASADAGSSSISQPLIHSPSDQSSCEEAHIYQGGSFHKNGAALGLIQVDLPFVTSNTLPPVRGGGSLSPILAWTADMMRADATRYAAAGCDGLLPKSFIEEHLSDFFHASPNGNDDAPQAAEAVRTELDSAALAQLESLARRKPGFSERVIRLFLDTAPTWLEQIESAAAREDFEAMQLQSHTLKSSSMVVGAADLGGIAGKVETASAHATSRLPTLLLELRQAMNLAIPLLHGYLDSHSNGIVRRNGDANEDRRKTRCPNSGEELRGRSW